ncbi:hypothetical protein BS50DRAFT_608685 [Corynespora cassiicola Philippines]|uniref:Cell polarity protein-like protein n=1 Tax=Corynespora cassiicola Philippines TaxID=1448308 RepID=A0A2T2NXE6_CORCC|nr:hypothetical protein BS50DRAFT_608685 [Corynespora cassiicola Philippines]
MSFLFGKKNKQQQQQQSSALPPASRNIGSSHGQASQIPTANGASDRDPEKSRGAPPPQQQQQQQSSQPPTQTSTPGGSVNNSLNSLQNQSTSTSSPEPKTLRDRADSDFQSPRNARNVQESPYPWSNRRLNFTTNSNPFPRYGPAINATASKDGVIYIMGGLVGGATVKGDLWLTEVGNGSMACYPISTTGDGPGPRVGHSSLLVGNAFIVFGGDTKLEDNDDLDDTLYLLNTSTKHWSRALPQGPRPTGRYGHTLNILGSKIYIFGGQVEGVFFNDLVAFDLNSLQSSSSRWEVLHPSQNTGTVSSPQVRLPPARTNHSIVTWNDKLYLFGGTDGLTWFNDVWTYEPRSNSWTELDCIGYIPVAREGHSATLVNDTMYIFGGRTQEGVDLGDLAAFRISSRRWYMFQNMGASPSARSGHSMTAFGKHVIVMGGEPSSSASDRNELSLAYILDTSKIRYPPNETAAPPQQQQQQQQQQQPVNTPRKLSGGDRSNIPQGKGSAPASRASMVASPQGREDPTANGAGSRLPRAAGPPGPPPLQQPPQPRANGARSKTPTKAERGYGPPIDTRAASFDRENLSPVTRDSPSTSINEATGPRKGPEPKESMDTTRSGSLTSRNTSRSQSHRQQQSLDSVEQGTPRRSIETNQRSQSHEVDHRPVDSGNDELLRELEAAKSRNVWYSSELALARKAGYNPATSPSPIIDDRSADALIKMKNELERVQSSIRAQGDDAAKRIAEVEKQRDAAVSEAIYAKAKLAAHGGGSQSGTPQPDGARSTATPDFERVNDINRRLAISLAAQSELSTKLDKLTHELEGERKAKMLAEETAEAAQRRHAAEFESLQAAAREASASAAEAEASAKLARLSEESKSHAAVLQSLREASAHLEKKLEEEKYQAESLRQKLAQLRADHEERTAELEAATQKHRDAEELADKYAEEARLHRDAMADIGNDENDAVDERVAILQQQVEAANIMKLRRAEERIAGLEAYQEQSSREGLTIRKQLQQAMREVQASEAEKAELHQQHERLRLESNAFEVQLKTLKNLLEERGVNPVDARRSRVLDSPSSRFGTPELNHSMNKAHEEMRGIKEWEEKLQALHNDHQAAKMLSKMKQELDQELNQAKQAAQNSTREQSTEWQAERASLQSELSSAQENMKTTVAKFEKQLAELQAELASARQEAEIAAKNAKEAESSAEQTRSDLETLRSQHAAVEKRAQEAETRVQMFLDQFESSVDNYRRQSQAPGDVPNGVQGHRPHDSIASGDSLYSDNDGSSTPDAGNGPNSAATRNSMALDNLASELDALRSHWETTNKAYRLSDRFDFERTPTSEKSELSESLSQWRQRMDIEDDDDDDDDDKEVTEIGPAEKKPAPSGPGGSAMI